MTNQQLHLSISSNITHVNYSCGSCSYELNLNSSNRNTSSLNYGNSSINKKNRYLPSFFSVDGTRFTPIPQQFSFSWISFFTFQRTTTTKLLCRNCMNHIGYARTFPSQQSHSWDGISDSRIFYIKLNAIQPSS